MAARIPSETEVLSYFETLSNWGRWGRENQLGTLNLATPQKRLQAAQLIREGVTLSCSRPITTESAPDIDLPALHFMVESGEGWASGAKQSPRGTQVAMDFIGMRFHGLTITHIDALSHFFVNARMYNGHPSDLVTTREGATAESIELLQNGVVSRGILLDVAGARGVDWLEPGEGVFPEDLEAAETAAGVRVEPGDVLLIRTGHYRRRLEEGPTSRQQGYPGPHAACLPWFRHRDIAMLGSDTANDVSPPIFPKVPQPIHQVGIVAMGLWLIDNCNLEELATACRQRNRWEFLLFLGPLRIRHGTGSPVNPVAVF